MLQKYFIAIVPPEPLLSDIQQIKKTIFDDYKTKGALRSPAHITLHMPFSWEEEKEEKLISELSNFKFPKNINIQLQNYACFEPRVVFIDVVQSQQLIQLQKSFVLFAKSNLQLFNQSDDMRGFHPHVTVAFRDLKKPAFYKIWETYNNKHFAADFDCNSVCLLKHIHDRWIVYRKFIFAT